jgi:hypothetical protein
MSSFDSSVSLASTVNSFNVRQKRTHSLLVPTKISEKFPFHHGIKLLSHSQSISSSSLSSSCPSLSSSHIYHEGRNKENNFIDLSISIHSNSTQKRPVKVLGTNANSMKKRVKTEPKVIHLPPRCSEVLPILPMTPNKEMNSEMKKNKENDFKNEEENILSILFEVESDAYESSFDFEDGDDGYERVMSFISKTV